MKLPMIDIDHIHREVTALTAQEILILEAAKEANPWWLQAVLHGAKVMLPRRQKYTGAMHPYYNFADMMRRGTRTALETFLFYVDIKRSRISVTTTDFADESFLDTLIDLMNYAILLVGWFVGQLSEESILGPKTEITDDEIRRTVALDFDGVFNKFKGWTGQYQDYEPLDGIRKGLENLTKHGKRIVISTARPEIQPVLDWLDHHNLSRYIAEVTNKKPLAVRYVDDMGITFRGDFDVMIEEIERFSAWWEEKSS